MSADKEELYCEGIDHYGEGRNDEAERCFRAAIAVDPAYGDAWEGLAMTLGALQRLEEAIEAAKQWAAIDPEQVMPHTTLSMLYQKAGNIPAAEEEGGKARMLGWKADLKAKKAAATGEPKA
jgi:tetratricopeptide (TPR) repeat protein